MKIEYYDKSNRDKIIADQTTKGLFLIEDRIEGVRNKKMYLIFADAPNEEPPEEPIPAAIKELEARIEQLEAEVQSFKQEAI